MEPHILHAGEIVDLFFKVVQNMSQVKRSM